MIRKGGSYAKEVHRGFRARDGCLTLTSGRSQSSICEDLDISRTTLVRWLAKHRGDGPGTAVVADDDVIAELHRLRRENEVLRQERDILKKATVLFAREGSR